MKKKKLLLPAFLLTALFTLASCGEGSRNTSVPYGSLDTSSIIASSNDKDINLTLDTFYTKLRSDGYNIVLNKIKQAYYKDYFNAVNDLIFKNYNELTSDELIALSYSDTPISSERFDELKTKYYKSISDSLASSIISTSSYEDYIDLKPTEAGSDYEKAIYKYIQTQNRNGYDLDASYISFSQDANDEEHILIDLEKYYVKGSNIVDSYILDYAEDFYVGSKIYEIAEEEYILESDDSTTKTKNQYYLFKDEKYKTTFNNYFKDYGTYNAIVITFASRKEAMQTIENVFGTPNYEISSLNDYLALYNYYYESQQINGTPFVIDDDVFNYTVNEESSGFSGVVDGVKSLITDVLEDGEFLTEPRNLSGNYVLVYRNKTTYDVSGDSTLLKWENLTDEQKNDYIEKLQINLIEDSISSYTSTAFKKLIKDSDLEIYDPIFEAKFYNVYTDEYSLIDKSQFNENYIFKLNDEYFTVEDFYDLASKRLGTTIITDYFEQSYAAKYIDDYLDSDTQSANLDSLNSVIDSWKNSENSTYPKSIGLENFLVANYGYKTKDEVLKYYFNAKSALSSYLSETIFDEWAIKDESRSTEDTIYYTMSDECKELMTLLLETGNTKYNEIFSVNIDHILIYVDFDNDGTPDDPNKYLEKHPDLKTIFEEEITSLAKAIYTEALNDAYSGNSLYSILSYISEQYTKGSQLRAGDVNNDGVIDTWDDYKTIFRFQLRAEQLSSSSDVDQDSVANFVLPFANYVKDLYAKAVSDDADIDSSYGVFFTPTDGELTDLTDVDKISIDTLCQTVYGYHLLVLNSYDGADSLIFSAEKDDPNGYQAELKLLIYEDEDDSNNNIYITIDSYNEDSSTEATLNQLFIYYIEAKRNASTSLDSKIYSTLQDLFSDVINKYTSSNFLNLVLLDEINITSENEYISNMISLNRQYYVDLVCNYGEDDNLYSSWCEISNHYIFVRPDQK